MPAFRTAYALAEGGDWSKYPVFTRYLSDVSSASSLEAAIKVGGKLKWDANDADVRTISGILPPENNRFRFQVDGGKTWYAAELFVNGEGEKVITVRVQLSSEQAAAEGAKGGGKAAEAEKEFGAKKEEAKKNPATTAAADGKKGGGEQSAASAAAADGKKAIAAEDDSGFGAIGRSPAGAKKEAARTSEEKLGAASSGSEEKPTGEKPAGASAQKEAFPWEKCFFVPDEQLDASQRGVDPAAYVVAGPHAWAGKKVGSYQFPWVDGTLKTVSYSKKQGKGVVFKIAGSEQFYFAGIMTNEVEGVKTRGLQVWKYMTDEKQPGKPSGSMLPSHPLHGKVTFESVFGKGADPGGMLFKALDFYFPGEKFGQSLVFAIGSQIRDAAHDARPKGDWVGENLSIDAKMARDCFTRSEQGSVYFLMRAAAGRGASRDFYHDNESPASYSGRMMREAFAEFFAGIFCGYTQMHQQQAKELAMLLGSGAFSLSDLLKAYFLEEKNSCYVLLLEFEKYRPQDKDAAERFIKEKGFDAARAYELYASLAKEGFFPRPS